MTIVAEHLHAESSWRTKNIRESQELRKRDSWIWSDIYWDFFCSIRKLLHRPFVRCRLTRCSLLMLHVPSDGSRPCTTMWNWRIAAVTLVGQSISYWWKRLFSQKDLINWTAYQQQPCVSLRPLYLCKPKLCATTETRYVLSMVLYISLNSLDCPCSAI